MKDKKRGDTASAASIPSPFAILGQLNVPARALAADDEGQPVIPDDKPAAHRGRLDIVRNTAHRGGKTVTVITGFVGANAVEMERLAKQLQKACGAGGTVKAGRIEIQGDQRQTALRILGEAGFCPVLAGG